MPSEPQAETKADTPFPASPELLSQIPPISQTGVLQLHPASESPGRLIQNAGSRPLISHPVRLRWGSLIFISAKFPHDATGPHITLWETLVQGSSSESAGTFPTSNVAPAPGPFGPAGSLFEMQNLRFLLRLIKLESSFYQV